MSMSRLINFVLICLFLISCHYSEEVNFALEEKNQESLIKHLSNSTAVLLIPGDDSKFIGSCAGVFVAPQRILTAKHCLEPYLPYKKVDISSTDASELLKILILIDQQAPELEKLEMFQKDWSKIDSIQVPIKLYSQLNDSFYENQNPSPYRAVLIATDSNNDLALLKVTNPIKHEYVTIANKNIFLGQKIHVIGHPASLEYTYHQGFVSGERFRLFEEKMQHYLQVSSAIFNGNSGGGAFDAQGNLLGICSIYLKEVPQISYFVHINEIKKFIEPHIK